VYVPPADAPERLDEDVAPAVLRHEPRGAGAEGAGDQAVVGQGRDDDHGHVARGALEADEAVEAFDVGELQVQEDDVGRRRLGEAGDAVGEGDRRHHLVDAEGDPKGHRECLAEQRVVVDDQRTGEPRPGDCV
jgi:hypothetical protein